MPLFYIPIFLFRYSKCVAPRIKRSSFFLANVWESLELLIPTSTLFVTTAYRFSAFSKISATVSIILLLGSSLSVTRLFHLLRMLLKSLWSPTTRLYWMKVLLKIWFFRSTSTTPGPVIRFNSAALSSACKSCSMFIIWVIDPIPLERRVSPARELQLHKRAVRWFMLANWYGTSCHLVFRKFSKRLLAAGACSVDKMYLNFQLTRESFVRLNMGPRSTSGSPIGALTSSNG